MKLAAIVLSLLALLAPAQIENHVNVTGWPRGEFLKTDVKYPINVQVVGDDLPDFFVVEFRMEAVEGVMQTSGKSVMSPGRVIKTVYMLESKYYTARMLHGTSVLRSDNNTKWDGVIHVEIIVRNPKKEDFDENFLNIRHRPYFEAVDGKIHVKKPLRAPVMCLRCSV